MKKKEIKTTIATTIKPSLKILSNARAIPAESNLNIKCDEHKII